MAASPGGSGLAQLTIRDKIDNATKRVGKTIIVCI